MSHYCNECKTVRTQGCFLARCPGIPTHYYGQALPQPDRTLWQYGEQIDHYTADQMHAYALACNTPNVAVIARLRSALDKIAERTGSDDPCRDLVQIARDALTPNVGIERLRSSPIE